MWGRGGAGNIQQAVEASKQRAPETQDLEAANPPISPDDTTTTAHSPPPQEYAHMGRGGAGNYYSPSTLTTTGTFVNDAGASTTNPAASTAEPPPAPLSNLDSSSNWWNTASAPRPQNTTGDGGQQQQQQATTTVETPVARTGRGGAGNYVWGSDVSERRAEQIRREWGELRERERGVKQKVAEVVESELPPPPAAFLGSSGAGSGAK
ncbi:hypothetical protein BFW01_g7733 [Lasiodiplodia theobromae]|nr:hypothetical protein BFW01_g7733 [Lasiodiplodia theobromae]